MKTSHGSNHPHKARDSRGETKPQILYEDRHLLVAVKPPGMLSQGDITHAPDMLTEVKKILWEASGRTRRPFLALVHRLDRPTSGLMVFARSSKAASRLAEAFRTKQVVKEYAAIARGMVDETGAFSDLISSRKDANGRMQIRAISERDRREGEARKMDLHTSAPAEKENGRGASAVALQTEKRRSLQKPREPQKWTEASLSWTRLSYDARRNESLLLITLSTGKKHQIRAQFAAHGLPLLGDRRYGKDDARDESVPTVALHACRLAFCHPVEKTRCAFTSLPDVNPSFSKEDIAVLKKALDA